MVDRPWKAFERTVASLIGGKRYWANSGERVDAESDNFVAQCKNVKTCSLAELERLASEIEREGKHSEKVGVVAVKRRAGAGIPTKILFVMTEDAWKELLRRAENPVKGEPDRHDIN